MNSLKVLWMLKLQLPPPPQSNNSLENARHLQILLGFSKFK